MNKPPMSANHFFLTGQIQVGKTTLIRRVLAELGALGSLGDLRVGGFRTITVPDVPGAIGSVYILPFAEKEIPECGTAAAEARRVGIRWGRGRFDAFPEVFECEGIRILSETAAFDLLVYDELGLMESRATSFARKVLDSLDGEIPILGVVKPAQAELLNAIRAHQRVKVFEITEENREEMFPLILEELRLKLWRQRRDSAGAVVLRQGAEGPEVLMVRSRGRSWGMPKGHIEEGESELAAAAREVWEETGIKARVNGDCLLEMPSCRPGDKRKVRLYFGSCEGGVLTPAVSEIGDTRWVAAGEAAKLLAGKPEEDALRVALSLLRFR